MKFLGKIQAAVVFSLVLTAFSTIPMASPLTPEELSPPRITSPLYNGAKVVEVWGFTSKAEVRIYADNVDIGGGICPFGKCTFNVEEISTNQKITATQTVDGVTSFPTRDQHAVTVQKIPDPYRDPKYMKERLVAPAIDSPLVDCQRIVPVKNIVEGALVQVFSLPNIEDPIGRTSTPWNYARPATIELKRGQRIAAKQKLFFPPSDLSPEKVVDDKKKIELKDPVVNEASLVVGNDTVEVWNLWIGAKVDIYYEEGPKREPIGGGVAPWPSTIFPVKPLKPAWVGCAKCIKADQSLCGDDKDGIKATSSGKSVKNSLDPPTIKRPICAGSIEVTICNTVPHAPLKIFLKGSPDKQVGEQSAIGSCTPVTLGNSMYLNNGDGIYATQTVGKLKSRSDTVKVVDKSDPVFEIGNGKFCKPCSGQDRGPTFVRGALTNKYGPVFKAAMCGAEQAVVKIRGPNDGLIETITLEEIKGKKGYFEGKWDWKKIGWNSSKDIPFGKYRAAFEIWPTGPNSKQVKYFYVTVQGCVECAVMDFHQTCVERINKLRALENLAPLMRDQVSEGCSDSDAKVNYETKKPHYQMCGAAQNECSTYSSTSGILDVCIEQQMYYEEKTCYERYQKNDPKACYSLTYNPACECQYGHYANMTNTNYTKLACGIYVTPEGELKAVMNFW